jgi:hypothetical protein
MNPRDLGSALTALIPTGQAVFVKGAPGTGKSSVVYQSAAGIFDGSTVASAVGGFPEVDWFLPIRAVDRDPIDFRGVLYVADGKSRWTTPDLMERLGPDGGVICIEELPQAVPAVQCVLRELLLERAIAGHRIPKTWTVIATGNRQEDRAGAGRLLSHVASSVVILSLTPSIKDWQKWALERGIRPEIRSFLNFLPALLHDFDPSREINTDPRGWERISNIMDSIPERLQQEVFGGTVHEAAAGQFIDYLALCSRLPDPDEVLKHPDTATIPTEASVRWALSGAIVERCRKADHKTVEAAATYTGRLPAEIGAKMFIDMTALQPQVATMPQLKEFAAKHPDIWATSVA